MPFDIDPCAFEFLRVAKDLYDHGLLDKTLKNLGNMEICEDSYAIAWEGTSCVFESFRQYFNEDKEIETMVFQDPVITDFYRLCTIYEAQKGVEKADDPYRRNGEDQVYSCFSMDAYCFDVLLYDGSSGAPRMVFLSGSEFYGHGELPGVLGDVRDTFDFYIKRLKEALDAEAAETTQKEAA